MKNESIIASRVSMNATPNPAISIDGSNIRNMKIEIILKDMKSRSLYSNFENDLVNLIKKYTNKKGEDDNMENNEKNLYLAGSLFSEAEISQRLKEGKAIRGLNEYDVYNPIEAPCNDKAKLPTDQDIFLGDTREVLKSDVIVADLSNNDVGVMAELAISWTINYIHKLAAEGKSLDEILEENPKKKIIAHLSDIRKGTANKYNGNYIPWGYNQYIIGMIENDGQIKENFAEVIEELKELK